jgi:Ca2+-transporting ATPase
MLAAVALGLSLLLVLWYGLRAGAWVQGLLAGIALAMALLPEEFPMALAVFLSLGAWRLARAQVLTRRPAVIEALGAITVLCVDKTGTLTENRMQVRRLVTECCDLDLSEHPADQPWPDSVRRLMEYAMLASHRGGVEPMDAAILGRGDDGLAGTVHLHPDWLLARDYPITPNRLAISRAWTDADGQPRVAAKGAPEAIADLCHLRPEIWDRLQLQVQALAQQGLRVLAVAEGLGSDPAAEDPHDYDFRWLGLLAFEDPLRPSVRPAMGVATRAGIAVVMITGDHPSTALAIAAQAGIDTDAGVLTGQQLQAMDEAALAQAVRSVRVYARVAPQDKLRLVQALRANGETVAMTGDGVNDAPALKAAHVGIAMGRRGTDVAREAASVVLLEEEFGRIVEGVALGRRIFENLRKVMTYIMAIHIPIAGLALLPLLLGLPPLMLPVHVVITEMIIDPVCSLAFENAPQARDAMTRPPRPPQATLVQGAMVRRALCQGAALLAAVLAVYVLALQGGARTDEARALAFIGLTAGNLALVVSNAMGDLGVRALWSRAFLPLWGIALAASGLLALALGWPAARALLQFDVPDFAPLVLAAAAPVGLVLVASQLTARRI